MDMIQETLKHWRHAQGKLLDTEMMLHTATQCGYHKTIRHVHGRKDERDAGEVIRNLVY